MNILLIAPNDPDRMANGGCQRTHFLSEALKRLGTVFTIVPVLLPALEKEDAVRRIRWVCIQKRPSLAWVRDRTLARLFPSIFLPVPRKLLREKIYPGVTFDAVVTRYTQWAAVFSAWQYGPLFIDIDDYPIEAYETMIAPHRGRLMRWLERRVLKTWCAWVYGKCRGAWIANGKQEGAIKGLEVTCLPNLATEPPPGFAFTGKQREMLLTVGYLGYQPNYEGVDRFLKVYWPAIRAAFPQMEYDIVGKDCPSVCAEAWRQIPGVKVLGFVDDLSALYEQCLATVAPIYSGSGTCIKVPESLLRGRICIASDFALRGWPEDWRKLENGILKLDDVEQLITALTAAPWKAEGLATRLPAFIHSHFGFEEFTRIVRGTLNGLPIHGQ